MLDDSQSVVTSCCSESNPGNEWVKKTKWFRNSLHGYVCVFMLHLSEESKGVDFVHSVLLKPDTLVTRPKKYMPFRLAKCLRGLDPDLTGLNLMHIVFFCPIQFLFITNTKMAF